MSPGSVCCIPFMVFLLVDVDRLGLCQELFSVELEWNECKWRHTSYKSNPYLLYGSLASPCAFCVCKNGSISSGSSINRSSFI